MKFFENRNKFLVVAFCALFLFSGCSKSNDENQTIETQTIETQTSSSVSDIAFYVNDYNVSKEYISQVELITGVKFDKESLNELIKQAAMNAEAIRLGIEPDSEELKFQLDTAHNALINSDYDESYEGMQWLLQHLEEVNVSIDEYILYNDKLTYDSLQRKALWEYVEKNTTWDDPEKYCDDLVSKANIQIFDPDLKALLN